MKTIIAGSRGIDDSSLVIAAIGMCGWEVTEVVSGGARGVDRCGQRVAAARKIPFVVMNARWNVGGKTDRSAGIKRNIAMAEYAEALIAVWDGKSTGTKHMIEVAKKKGLKVYIHQV